MGLAGQVRDDQLEHSAVKQRMQKQQGSYRENDIICADARSLTKYVRPHSVDLTVTSPPYRNAINYTQHASDLRSADRMWMRGTGADTTEAYVNAMQQIFDQVFKVTKPGGFCCIVIGDEVVNGKIIPLPSLLLSRLASSEDDDDSGKWNFRDMIIWHKVTSGRNGSGNRFGVFIQSPYPKYYRANIMHEYILILQKGRPVYDNVRIETEKIPLNRIVKRDIANSIWNIAPVPPKSTDHPAPFPEQIPWRLAILLTKKGDMILDPMNGSGQTTKVACNLGRRYLGFDVRREYVTEAKKRLRQKTKLSECLFPVYHTEKWVQGDQSGYFDTIKVDFTSNIPSQYKFVFKTESDKSLRGVKGVHTYYKNPESCYICFTIGSNGKHSRLGLGNVENAGDMLHDVLASLPKNPFIKADLNRVLEAKIKENHQPAKACIDVLMHIGYVDELDKTGRLQYYQITRSGMLAQRSLKKRPKAS